MVCRPFVSPWSSKDRVGRVVADHLLPRMCVSLLLDDALLFLYVSYSP
jgi:hypothetical protein